MKADKVCQQVWKKEVLQCWLTYVVKLVAVAQEKENMFAVVLPGPCAMRQPLAAEHDWGHEPCLELMHVLAERSPDGQALPLVRL